MTNLRLNTANTHHGFACYVYTISTHGKGAEEFARILRNVSDRVKLEIFVSADIMRKYLKSYFGLHFMFSNNDKYEENVFTRNGAGVAVMFSKFIYMYKNWKND